MNKIDFIITWVDGNDPIWQQEKSKYQWKNNVDSRNRRYRDWGTLPYWFRSIEKYAPWVNKVFLVTYGHLPKWLNLKNPKLRIINHKDYIPERFLPTFSSRTIDMNFHLIKDLSEYFVYFNDDMFLTNHVKPTDFFKNGLPCDTAILNVSLSSGKEKSGKKLSLSNVYTAAYFDTMVINQNFNKKKCILRNLAKWFSPQYGLNSFRTILLLPWQSFPGFMSYHMPYSYLKSIYREVWEKEPEILSLACEHKFREITDVNHWLFSYWQIASGKFYPRSPNLGKQIDLRDNDKDNEILYETIKKNKHKIICINDSVDLLNYERIKNSLLSAFEYILPNKSSFEM